MHILGKLGFDWKLIVIQIINFLALFYILKLLFFKPVIRGLKDDIKKKRDFEKEKEELENKIKDWQREKERMRKEALNKAKEIIIEANQSAKQLHIKTEREIADYKEKYLKKIQERAKTLVEKTKKEVVEKEFNKLKEKFINELKNKNLQHSFKVIQDDLFLNLLEKVKKLDLEKEIKFYQLKNLQKLDNQAGNIKKTPKNNHFEQIILEYSFPPSKNQINQLHDIIDKKTGNKNYIFKQIENKNLISGFTLEIFGYILEENIRQLLNL